MSKKVLSVLITLSLSLGVLAGCGTNKKEEAISKEQPGEKTHIEQETDQKEDVSIQLWLTPQWKGVMDAEEPAADYDSFFIHAAEEFSNQYDKANVTVDVQVIPGDNRTEMLNVNLQAGTPPDIVFESVFAMGDFVHRGALLPIDDIIDQDAKDDIAEGIWENVIYGENVYAYPFSNMPGTLAYNADLFKEAGLENYIGEENEIKTWSLKEYEEILAKLKESLPTGAYPMALFAGNTQGDTWNLAYLRMFGSPFFSESDNLVVNDENGVKAMDWIKMIYDNKWTNPGAESVTSNDANAMFQNQQLAISFTNSVLFNNVLSDMEAGKAPKFDARLANIPSTSSDPLTFTYVTGSVIFDTEDEQRIQVAKDFVKFYSSNPELVKASKNGVPVRKTVADEFEGENPLFKAYADNAKNMFTFTGNVPSYLELREALYPEIQSVLIGEKTSKEALDSYVNIGNKAIEEGKKESAIYK